MTEPLKRAEYAGLFIDGQWRATAENQPVINPATEERVVDAPWGSAADAEAAVAAARRAFDEGSWPRMTAKERARIVRRFADVLRSWSDDIARLVTAEVGIPARIARASQVDVPLQLLDFFIERTESFEAFSSLPTTLTPDRSGTTVLGAGVIQREPRGVVTAITPFNAPFYVNMMKVAPALGAGCTVVLKPSDMTPLESLLLGAAAEEAELPSGVLNVVTGGPQVGFVLTTDPRVDMVTFTGSDTVGAQVMAQAAASLKHVVLELGGKSAMIVCEDADLDAAAPKGAQDLVTFTGQGCALKTRHLVHRSRMEEYAERVAALFARMPLGDPSLDTTLVGPLIRERQRDRVEHYVDEAREQGAEILVGGRRPSGSDVFDRGWWYEPTLVSGVTNAARIAQEEIFGPVGVLIPFETDEEAVAMANDSAFGLSGAVFSKDAGRAYGIATRMRTGNVGINGGSGGFSPWAPFGGYKRSGLGREMGADALADFCETKSIQFRSL